MAWQRWNQTTHIFEISNDNGGSWTPLPLNASVINEGNILILSGAIPRYEWNETAQPVDKRRMHLEAFNQALYLQAYTDAEGLQYPIVGFDRTTKAFTCWGSVTENNRQRPMGYWTDIPFTTASYGASGTMVWTVTAGTQYVYKVARSGDTLFVNFFVSGTISGTLSNQLYLYLPSSFVGATLYDGLTPVRTSDATENFGFAWLDAGGVRIAIQKGSASNFSSGNVFVGGSLMFRITNA